MQKSVLFMGLGYIGLPTAALVADAGLQVTGVDINENVVNNINNCDISNQEPGLQEIVEKYPERPFKSFSHSQSE